MRLDDAREIDRLNEELNRAVSSGNGGPRSSEPNALPHVHAQLRALDDTPLPDPAFVNRLMEDLMHTASIASTDRLRFSLNGFSGSASPPRGASAPPASPIARPRFGDGFALRFITAALVVLAIAVGWFASGGGRPGDGPAATHPAVFAAPGTAIPAATIPQTLAEYDIPTSALLPGVSGSAMSHFIIPASSTSTWTIAQEANLIYMLTGSLTLTSNKPIELRRAASSGTVTTTPAGVAVEISSGDSALLGDAAITIFVNKAATDVTTLTWIINAGLEGRPPMPYSWGPDIIDLSGVGAVTVPTGGAHIRLWRTELAGGATISPPNGMIVQLGFDVGTDAAGAWTTTHAAVRTADGSIQNRSTHPITVYGATLTSVGRSGSPVAAGPAASTPAT